MLQSYCEFDFFGACVKKHFSVVVGLRLILILSGWSCYFSGLLYATSTLSVSMW